MFKTISAGIKGIRVARGIKAVHASTDDNERQRARQYLADLLGEQKGIASKIGQLLAENGVADDPLQHVCDDINPLPLADIHKHLQNIYDEEILDSFLPQNEAIAAASLSQVHRTTFHDQDIVLKIQYPGIRKLVEADLKLLGLIPGVGPAKKWNIDLEGYRRHLKSILDLELDYKHEAQQQQQYRSALDTDEHIIVPEIIESLSNDQVVAQSYCSGHRLSECVAWSTSARTHIAKTLIRHFFKQLFCRQQIHADPHDGNYRFLNSDTGDCVVLYDFGCLQSIDPQHALALLSLILHTHKNSAVDPLELYVQAGYDREKLTYIHAQLPAISKILFQPFLRNERFQTHDWHVSTSIKNILGDHAWWFRSSGPCNALLIVRAFSGLVRQVRALNAYVNWYEILEESCQHLFEEALSLGYDIQDQDSEYSFQSIAQHLTIQIKKNGRDHVSLNLPAQAVLDLKTLIDSDVQKRIRNKGIDLDNIVDEARRSGFQQQSLFELAYDNKEFKIKLS